MRHLYLILLFFVFPVYCQEWYSINDILYKYQLKHKVFNKKNNWNKKYAKWFWQARNNVDLLKLTNCQVGDTLYLNEYIATEGLTYIYIMSSKKDNIYEVFLDGENAEVSALKLRKTPFVNSEVQKLVMRWNIAEMQYYSSLYPGFVFDGGVEHYVRIVLRSYGKSCIQTFVTRGFNFIND